jgi:dihydrolipoamide dehydrogenase
VVVGELTEETQLLVIGGGPGGYVAAFKAADLGIETTLVDAAPVLGGVCLREGCIPSKALLHVAHLITHAAEADGFGITFGKPKIDVEKLRRWKQSVVDRLCGGVNTLAKHRNVRVIRGRAVFEDSRTARVQDSEAARIKFKNAVIATGSRPARLPESVIPADCCIDSTRALDLEAIPKTLLVVGGGYIGLELGQAYAALGSKVTVVELLNQILPGVDPDLVRPLAARLKKQFEAIHTSTKLEAAQAVREGTEVTFSKAGEAHKQIFERVLVSVGRVPSADNLGLENTTVKINESGFIEVDEQRRTADRRIFAIGDVAGNPMLAHKASHEGIVAAEAIAGKPSVFDPRAIPAVVYTSPEIAWCGLAEAEAKEQGLEIKVGKFPWGASGRAITMGRPEGLTKIIADANTRRILGVGIVGENAGDLIAEAALAMEMGAETEDVAMTIHPHPATSETLMEAAESVFGKAIHSVR